MPELPSPPAQLLKIKVKWMTPSHGDIQVLLAFWTSDITIPDYLTLSILQENLYMQANVSWKMSFDTYSYVVWYFKPPCRKWLFIEWYMYMILETEEKKRYSFKYIFFPIIFTMGSNTGNFCSVKLYPTR